MTSSKTLAHDASLADQVLLGHVAAGSCSGDFEAYVWPAAQQELQFGLEVAVTGLREALRRGDMAAARRWILATSEHLVRLERVLPVLICRRGPATDAPA